MPLTRWESVQVDLKGRYPENRGSCVCSEAELSELRKDSLTPYVAEADLLAAVPCTLWAFCSSGLPPLGLHVPSERPPPSIRGWRSFSYGNGLRNRAGAELISSPWSRARYFSPS